MRLDIVFGTSDGSFLTLINNGEGAFSQFSTPTDFPNYVSFAVAHVNSDGYADVFVSPQDGNYAELFLSTGNGLYQAGKKIAIPNAE